jgi:hypothetical protein
MARRREGVRLARTINNLEVNQPGAKSKKFLAQADLSTSAFAAQATGPQADFLRQLDFTHGERGEARLDADTRRDRGRLLVYDPRQVGRLRLHAGEQPAGPDLRGAAATLSRRLHQGF